MFHSIYNPLILINVTHARGSNSQGSILLLVLFDRRGSDVYDALQAHADGQDESKGVM